jgi:hypothetical protein
VLSASSAALYSALSALYAFTAGTTSSSVSVSQDQGRVNLSNADDVNQMKLDRFHRRLWQYMANDLDEQEPKFFLNYAQDYFIVTRDTFDWQNIPDFVVGRPAFDNWFVDHIHHDEANASLIDASETIIAIHQSGKLGDKSSFQGIEKKDPKDAYWNRDLGKWQWDHGRGYNAQYKTVWTAKQSNVHSNTSDQSAFRNDGNVDNDNLHDNPPKRDNVVGVDAVVDGIVGDDLMDNFGVEIKKRHPSVYNCVRCSEYDDPPQK